MHAPFCTVGHSLYANQDCFFHVLVSLEIVSVRIGRFVSITLNVFIPNVSIKLPSMLEEKIHAVIITLVRVAYQELYELVKEFLEDAARASESGDDLSVLKMLTNVQDLKDNAKGDSRDENDPSGPMRKLVLK
jgi:hypothetical protein